MITKLPEVVHNSTGTLVHCSTGNWCAFQPAVTGGLELKRVGGSGGHRESWRI
jgi:hypothetical protein